jgi:hypothetical protein
VEKAVETAEMEKAEDTAEAAAVAVEVVVAAEVVVALWFKAGEEKGEERAYVRSLETFGDKQCG